MPLITWEVGLKLKMTKHCVLAAADIKNADANSDNIILQLFLQFRNLNHSWLKLFNQVDFLLKVR